ncbi:MAG: Glu-tRNA(Gln) amidotransferase subunit GatE [Candidatus Hydrothermarchaeales archaeon]
MKIGFEIHQQIDTNKLFCSSPSVLKDYEAEYDVKRRLRPSQSELGVVDEAAMKEFLKGKSVVYKGYNDTICLVELDEEPPRGPNEKAVEIALTIALMLNAKIVDEIHFMRKVVIDGSNTAGFQRTAIIAFDGYMETEEGKINIPTICFEEEAARKVDEDELTTTYNLDRLGIPLIEITTAPDIKSPKQARGVALKIGELLRATGRVKRGIGTIRQDINVSIEGGARVEIKGVQDLNTTPKTIENEVERQKGLIKIKNKLIERGVKERDVKSRIYDVTEAFRDTESKVIRRQIKSGRVLAVKLSGFGGLLGGGLLGREIARSVRVHAGVSGIFHSDELPAYGITAKEMNSVKKALEMKEGDAFVLVAEKENRARKALDIVLDRARLALRGPLEETRTVKDSETEYMRPLPGAARMYPETDILPYVVSPKLLKRLAGNLPESYEEKASRLSKGYGINTELANQVVRSLHADLFEDLAATGLSTTVIATTILGVAKDLNTGLIKGGDLKELFSAFSEKKVSKEAIPEILEEMRKGKTAAEALGERAGGEVDLEDLVDRLIVEKAEFIKEKGMYAQKPLMGLVMKEARGKVDGGVVNEVVKRKLEEFLSK